MKEVIIKLLKKHVLFPKEKLESLVEIPPNPEMGDFAFPCFILANELKKNPIEIATDLAHRVSRKLPKEISEIKAINGYLNFFINKELLVETIINEILKKKEKYGKGKEKGKVALEHTSLNPNSSPHVGRARNSFIGDSFKRILELQGYDVETYYYVNDVSKQIALLAMNFKGNPSFDDLLKIYVNINKRIKETPELEQQAFDLLKKFEDGDKATRKLFKRIVDIAVKGQINILKKFGIKFNKFDYESKYIDISKELIPKFNKTGLLFKDNQDRLVLNEVGHGLEKKMKEPVLVLARSNGTGLYAMRDIAYTLDKLKRCKKTYIVLGEDQKLYFEQIKAALKILGKKAPEVLHYSYVLIQENGEKNTNTNNKEKTPTKMSTRKGEVVLLEDFMNKAVDKAKAEIKKRKTKGDAEKVGYGAVKYAMLKNGLNKNIIFNWEHALNFDGNSGPYLQYSYARANSILRKCLNVNKTEKIKLIDLHEKEIKLAKKLSEFPHVSRDAYKKLDPSLIANYAFELAQVFNEFYQFCPVVGTVEQMQRIGIVKAFTIVQKSALDLLGIEVMKEM